MMRLATMLFLGGLAAGAAAAPAQAQYYEPAPQPYYAPPPVYAPPPPRRVLGGRCNARLPTTAGPQRIVCPIVRPRPLGRPCVCPPPPPPPGYPPGPYLNGRVVS